MGVALSAMSGDPQSSRFFYTVLFHFRSLKRNRQAKLFPQKTLANTSQLFLWSTASLFASEASIKLIEDRNKVNGGATLSASCNLTLNLRKPSTQEWNRRITVETIERLGWRERVSRGVDPAREGGPGAVIVALHGERFRKGFSIGARYRSTLSADDGGQWPVARQGPVKATLIR